MRSEVSIDRTLPTRVLDGNAPEHFCFEALEEMQRRGPRETHASFVTPYGDARTRRDLAEHFAVAFEMRLRALGVRGYFDRRRLRHDQRPRKERVRQQRNDAERGD